MLKKRIFKAAIAMLFGFSFKKFKAMCLAGANIIPAGAVVEDKSKYGLLKG